MLSSLTPLVRPLAGSASASASTDSAAPPAPAGSTVPAADRGPSGASTSPSVGAYVPPLARGSDAGATSTGSRSAASAAYAEHGGDDSAASDGAAADDTSGSGRADTGRWMSASVTQPNAPSFSEAATKLQQGDTAVTSDRRASLDYLVSSMKRMQAAVSAPPAAAPEPTPAMRYATAAYIEF